VILATLMTRDAEADHDNNKTGLVTYSGTYPDSGMVIVVFVNNNRQRQGQVKHKDKRTTKGIGVSVLARILTK